jgi:hypothetical protein
MKLISRIVAMIVLGAAAPLLEAAKLVAHTSALTSNHQTVTTSALNTNGANFILVAAAAVIHAGTVTDSNRNTWTALPPNGLAGNGAGMHLFYCYNPIVSSAQTFTYSDPGIVYPSIAVAAFSGVAANPFDVQNGSYVFSGSGTVQTGSITPTQDGELIISAIGDQSNSADSINNSFNIIEHQNYGNGFGISLAYLIQGAAAPINPSWTMGTQTPGAYQAYTVASFKAVPGGGVQLISGGTAAMGTAAIPSGACAPAVTSSASGVAVNDTIIHNTSTDPTKVPGYAPSASGSLYIWAFPAANTVSFVVCNPSSSAITPGPLSLNWKVLR